jgi:hypothetical protein
MYSKYPFETFSVTWNDIIAQYDPDTVNDIVDKDLIQLLTNKMVACSYWALPYHLNPGNKVPDNLCHEGVRNIFNTKAPDKYNANLVKALTASVTVDTNKWSRRNAAVLARLRLFKGFGQLLREPILKNKVLSGQYDAFSFLPNTYESVIRWYVAGGNYSFDRRAMFHPFESYYTLASYDVLDRLARRVQNSKNTNFKGDVRSFKSDALICFLLEHKYYGFNDDNREINVELFKKHFGTSTPYNLKKEQLNFHLKTYNIRSVYNGIRTFQESHTDNKHRMYSITTYTRNSKVV